MQRALIVCLISFVWLAGCATAPSSLAPEQRAKIRNVGVVSLIGREINFTHVGFTVFGNANDATPVPEWNLDKYAVDVLRNALQKNNAYSVKSVDYDYASMARVYTKGIYSNVDFKTIEPNMRMLVQANTLDALLLVTTTRYQDPIGGRSINYEGLGIYSQGIGETQLKVAPYAWYILTVIDGQTLQPVASTNGKIEWQDKPLIAPKYSRPYRLVDNSWWSESL